MSNNIERGKLEQQLASLGFTAEDLKKHANEERTPKEDVENRRNAFRMEYEPILPLFQPRLQEFAEKHAATFNSETFPAVDIACGSSLGTVALALTTLNPSIYKPVAHNNNRNNDVQPGLIWYPTELEDDTPLGQTPGMKTGVGRTKDNLVYQMEEAPLFIDGNNDPVYELDIIELGGLKTASFNGRTGQIMGIDPKVSGRYGIHFGDPDNPKSFKKDNIFFGGRPSNYEATLYSLQKSGFAKDFFQGLLERIREVDIFETKTWSNVEELFGKCAFVTCTNLLTQIGYREPTAWKGTMQVASKLLHADGYLLQYDGVGYDSDFGTEPCIGMKEYAKSLGFELDFGPTNGMIHDISGRMRKIIIWKKS